MTDDRVPLDEEDHGAALVSTAPAALLMALGWPILHGMSTDDGLLWSATIGLGGTLLMTGLSAVIAGMIEGAVGLQRATSTAWAAVCAAAAVIWWRDMPTWSAGALSAVGVVGWLGMVLRERALSGLTPARIVLPQRAQAELDAVPRPLGDPLEAQRKEAVTAYLHIERSAHDLADHALVNGPSLRADAETTLIAALRQIRRLAEIREDGDPGLAEIRERGQARLTQLTTALQGLRNQLLTFVQLNDEGATPDLEAHAAQLEHAAVGLREVRDNE